MSRPDPYDNRASAPQPAFQAPTAPAPGRVGIGPSAPKVSSPVSAKAPVNAPAGDGTSPNPISHPSAAPIGTRFAVPAGPTPAADAMNSEADRRGYGPHATEAQADSARSPKPEPRVGVSAPQGAAVPPVDPVRAAMAKDYFAARQRHFSEGDSRTVWHPGGFDYGGWQETVPTQHFAQSQAAAEALSRYDATQAQIKQGDSIGKVKELAGLPAAARGIGLAIAGVDGPTIAGLPGTVPQGQSRFNATNYEQAASNDPETRDAAAMLANPNAEIHTLAGAFSSIPGIENPDSPHRQLWDAYMARRSANGDSLDDYGNTSPTADPGHALRSWLGRWGDTRTREIQARNQKFHADMGRLGYGFQPAGADGVRARVGVKPADY